MHGSVSVCVINNVSVYMYFVSVCKLGYMCVCGCVSIYDGEGENVQAGMTKRNKKIKKRGDSSKKMYHTG